MKSQFVQNKKVHRNQKQLNHNYINSVRLQGVQQYHNNMICTILTIEDNVTFNIDSINIQQHTIVNLSTSEELIQLIHNGYQLTRK